MRTAFIDRTRSRAARDEVDQQVARGESSYARLRAGQDLVIEPALGAAITDLCGAAEDLAR